MSICHCALSLQGMIKRDVSPNGANATECSLIVSGKVIARVPA